MEHIILHEEPFEITPVKNKNTRKQKIQTTKVNPPGKRGVKTKKHRNLPDDYVIEGELVV